MNIELSRDERNRLVKLRSEALAQHEAAMTLVGLYPPYSKAESEALAGAREAMERVRSAEEEYFEKLPAPGSESDGTAGVPTFLCCDRRRR